MLWYQLIDLVLFVGGELLRDPGASDVLVGPLAEPPACLAHQIQQLCNVEQEANARDCQHEDGEDSLLCRPGDEAVHSVGTRVRVTFHQTQHGEARVDEIEDEEETHFKDDAEEDADRIGPPQTTGDFELLVLYLLQIFGVASAAWHPEDPLVDMATVRHVHCDQQSRRGDKDDLQHPEADVWDWEEVVVADAVAARLLGVADEHCLLVTPDTLCCHHQHQDTEDEDDREPDAADARGVPIYAADHGIKGAPVHFRFQVWVEGNMTG